MPENGNFTLQHLNERYADLKGHLENLGSCLVAYSGGVDSSFLAAAAVDALGSDALAVTVSMASVPPRHVRMACDLAKRLNLNHEVIQEDQFAVPGFVANSAERCYHCKLFILKRLTDLARSRGITTVIEGANLDDRDDFRPGHKAVRECGVQSPLAELKWTKDEIRAASRLLGLPTADMPSYACLASRIPYGEAVTPDKLAAVDGVETCLETLDIAGARARHHDDTVRIELPEGALERLAACPAGRQAVVDRAKAMGFRYVTIDLEPYRSGRLNDELSAETKAQARL